MHDSPPRRRRLAAPPPAEGAGTDARNAFVFSAGRGDAQQELAALRDIAFRRLLRRLVEKDSA